MNNNVYGLVDPDWWRTAVVYQIYPRSFADFDGDGIGDLNGVRSKLSYLADLGVDAIWLTPFYPSPLADGGYDISNYRDVDPRLGTLTDFDNLTQDAHALGIKIIVDIVPNHTSEQHPWFQQALRAEPGPPNVAGTSSATAQASMVKTHPRTGNPTSAAARGNASPTASGTATCSPANNQT